MVSTAKNCKEKWIILLKEVFFSLIGNYLRPSNNSRQLIFNINAVVLKCYFVQIYENGEMFTWIWVCLLYSWKIETLFQTLKDQKLQTLQL